MAPDDQATESTTPASKKKETPVEVQKEGFTILAPGLDVIADIVFVHGLRGHPKDTWTFEPSGSNALSSVFKKKPKESIGTYWPWDVLKDDFPNVRIVTYGYDSHFTGSFNTTANQSGISDHGQDLLSSLEHIRRADPKRPLIFVAHSLGGLVVKEALRRSRGAGGNKAYLKDVYLATHAIIFFGTPHRGSSYAQLGQIYEYIAGSVVSTNKVLLEELKPNAQFLKVLREEFGSMIHEKAFEVYCFQEAKPLSNIRSKLVVNHDSSCLDDGWEGRAIINAHHRAMCRFTGKSDPGYVKVEGVISRYLEDIQKKKQLESQKCIKSLCTPGMYERRDLIETAGEHTFEWIFTDSRTGFKDWLLGDGQIFWIRGKPGSGKSTLLKYLREHDRTIKLLESQRPTQVITAGFYFYEQGTHLAQKNFTGLLLGILHELLSAMPDIFAIISNIYEKACKSDGWKMAELMSAFTALGLQTTVSGCICLFVDALDEYGGSPTEIIRELRQLLRLFDKSTFCIKICASSRPLPEFEAMLGQFPGFAIHDWTSNDIRQVVSQQLGEAGRGSMHRLSENILFEAKGVFLWVKLIIQELSPYMFDGDSEEELILRLADLPKELEAFYGHLLARIGRAKQPKLRSILQMISCDGNRLYPLTLAELSLAAKLPVDGRTMTDLRGVEPADDLARCKDMERRINSNLGGLLELVPNQRIPKSVASCIFKPLSLEEYRFTMQGVRFSHRTAREYIHKRINWDFFEVETALDNRLAGQLRLVVLYIHLAKSKQVVYYLDYDWNRSATDTITVHDTFLIENFAHHAREAEYYDYMSSSNRSPTRHDVWAGFYYPMPSVSFNRRSRTIERPQESAMILKTLRITLMEDFDRAMSGHDPNWFSDTMHGNDNYPSCFLAFCVLNGLFSYAKDVIDNLKVNSINRYDPPLLYWAIKSIKQTAADTAIGITDDEFERIEDFIQYLLQRGADLKSIFKIQYTQLTNDASISCKGVAEITILHYAWGLAVSEMGQKLLDAHRKITCILLEGGADANETRCKNYWYCSQKAPLEASPIHWLTLPVEFTHRGEVFKPEAGDPDPFIDGQSGKLLCKTIKAFLEHGADPNAVDSQGVDVLTSIMSTCPYEVAEYALEKGALITPLLLQDDGAPVRRHGILWEDRWRRPECYTPEARALVRKHMPHWEDSRDEKPVEDGSTDDVSVGEVSGDGGWVARMSSLIGWRP